MAETSLYLMAQCLDRRCGWMGGAYERHDISCPRCQGQTRAWPLDLAKEQAGVERLQRERSEAAQRSLDASHASRSAHDRLRAAQQQVTRCQVRLLSLEADHPGETWPVTEAKRALLAAELEAAQASLACSQATRRVQALERGRSSR